MSTVISRRSFLKCTGASAAALGAVSLLGGCKTNGDDTVVEVKVGDTVRNWNGLGVQLTSVFHLTQDPVQPAGYEYLGVRVTAVNRSKTESYAIGGSGTYRPIRQTRFCGRSFWHRRGHAGCGAVA